MQTVIIEIEDKLKDILTFLKSTDFSETETNVKKGKD
jgi:hypothetical protein